MDLKNIIDRINEKSQTQVFGIDKIDDIRKFLLSLNHLEYLSHGAQTICFSREKEVIKCCRKHKGSITLSEEIPNSLGV